MCALPGLYFKMSYWCILCNGSVCMNLIKCVGKALVCVIHVICPIVCFISIFGSCVSALLANWPLRFAC